MLCLFGMISIGASADEYDFSAVNSDGVKIYYNIISDQNLTCEVNCCDYSKEINIPSSVTYAGKSYSVTSIGQSAFLRASVTSVTIPNSVTSIGENAFGLCERLTSIKIPNSVIEIGDWAFSCCHGLKSITIGNNVTSIGQHAFEYCGLTSVTIPNSVTSIGDDAFYNCSSLTSVTIPYSVTSIGYDAFYGCYFQVDRFVNHSSLNAEANNYWGAKIYDIRTDDGLCITDNIVVKYCGNGTSVTIPNYVTSIGSWAFYSCSGLTSVTIPNSVTSIGRSAFYKCSGLTSVAIPNSVTSIEGYVFDGCSAMRSVYVEWNNASDIPSIGYGTFPCSQCTLYVPQGTVDLYLAKEYWKTFKSILGGLVIKDKDGNETSVYIDDSNPSFTLSDDINSIINSDIIKDVNVTYTRNFEKAGVWQAWYMPFDVAFDDMKDDYDVAQIHGVLLDKDNNAVLAFLKLDKGTVNANTPYVVRPKKSGEVAITTTTDLQPTQSNSFLMMSATDKYNIGGVFEKTTTPGNWYALNLDGQFQLMGSGVYLRPFRIYMTIDPRDDNPYAQSASTTAKMDIVVIGDGETTGIKESLTPALSEGKGAIYNLSGLRVNSIQKGQIYIMNGKKYIAK